MTDTGSDMPNPAKPRRGLSIAGAVLVFLLLPVSVVGLWNRALLLDTDRYIETVAPLAHDPDVQQAVTDAVTTFIVERARVQAYAEDLLPDRAKALAPFVAGGAESLIRQGVQNVVRSEWFAKAWVAANRADHALVVRLVTGREGKVTSTREGRIAVDLTVIAEQALKRIDEQFGVSLASRVDLSRHDLEFVLVRSDELARIQGLLRLAHQVLWVVVALTVAAAVATVLAAGARLKGLRRLGTAVTASMAVLLVAIWTGRSFYLTRLPIGMRNRPAPAAIYDILTRFLIRTGWALLVVGLVMMIVAWIVGSSRSAASVKGGFRRRSATVAVEPDA